MLLGGSLFAYLTVHLAQVAMRSSHGPAWWLTQLLFPVFGLAAVYFGFGALKKDAAALKAIKFLSIIGSIYFLAYSLMGAHSLIAVLVGVSGLLFFCASLYFTVVLAKQQT